MTISADYAPNIDLGNGTTRDFAVNFPFAHPADLDVTIFDQGANADIVPAPVLNGTGAYDYTVTGTIDPAGTGIYPNGTVHFNTAPPANTKVIRCRSTPEMQEVVLIDNARFPAKAVEGGLDHLELQIQEMDADLSRAVKAPVSDGPVDMTLPPAEERADTVLTFDGAGNIANPGISAGAIQAAIAAIVAGMNPVPLTSAWAPTLAAAKALYAPPVTLPNGHVVAVACRNTIGDGYFDQFIYDSADISTVFALDGLGYVDDAGRRWKRQPHQYIRQDWYVVSGIAGDGVTDESPALNAAVTDATNAGHKEVHVGIGQHRLTATITLHEGVPIIGVGGQGSAASYGVVYKCEPVANTPMFLWNGNGRSVAGTGGGLRNAFIAKNNAATPCTAIGILATDDNHRPGEMIFRNILIAQYDSTPFTWDKGFWIDGTAANTPGGKGVRTTVCEKVRVGSCATYCFHLNQAVHFWSTALEADQGIAAGCVSLIEGDWDNIWLTSCAINGTLTVNAVASPANDGNISGTGRIAILDVNAAHAKGSLAIDSVAITSAAVNLRITSNVSDAFEAVRTAPSAGLTGDGSTFLPAWSSEVFDKNASFDPTAGVFQAKIAGRYHAGAWLTYAGLASANTRHDTAIIHNNGFGGVLAAYQSGLCNPFAGMAAGAGGYFGTGLMSADVEMLEGQQLYVRGNVAGVAPAVYLFGGPIASGCFASFFAHLI